MPPLLATIIYGFGIFLLFYLEQDRANKVSRVLWLPALFLLINSSRPITFWLGMESNDTQQVLMEGSPIDALFAFGLLVAGLVVLYQRRGAVTRILRQNGAVILFVVYCGVSASWSDYPGVSFKRWIRFLGTFVTVLLILTDKDPLRAMKWVLTRVGFLLLPISILLIKYYPNIATQFDPWTGQRYVSGVASDKNMLGMLALTSGLALLVQFLAAWRERPGGARFRHLAAFGLALASAVWVFNSADSKTSESCFILGSLMLVVMHLFKFARRPVAEHILAVSSIAAAYGVLFLHIGEGAALQQLGRNSTLTGRTEIWSGLLAFAGNPLFGTGFDSFWLGDRLARIWSVGGQLQGINEAHNGYLETYLNLGWVGVALLAAVIVVGYRNISISLLADPEQGRLRLVFLVVSIIYNYTEAGFRTGSSVWITFLLAIWALPRPRIRKPLPAKTAWNHRSFGAKFEDEAELQRM
ncbi:MAG: O-antigen ligase family protein [Terracidiphilus sp.]